MPETLNDEVLNMQFHCDRNPKILENIDRMQKNFSSFLKMCDDVEQAARRTQARLCILGVNREV